MSKNQNFSGTFSVKSLTRSKKVPIKFITRIVSASQHSFTSSNKKSSSVSKHRNSANPSFTAGIPINSNFQEPKVLNKQLTISTENNSDRRKEVSELEKKLSFTKSIESPEARYSEILTVWSQALTFSNPLSNFYSMLKDEIEEIIKTITGNTKELQESKQTLKILKKRFQKLAFENLEVNNLIKEKENSLYRTKEKFRVFRESSNKEIKEKGEIVKDLRAQVVVMMNEVKEYKKRNKYLQAQARTFKKIVSAVRGSEDLSNEIKERILSLLSVKDNSFNADHSMSNCLEQSAILTGAISKVNSFFSSCDIDFNTE